MPRFSDENRRKSTVIRDNHVLDAYKEMMDSLGELAHAVSKSYIYDRLKERTGLCTKTIAFIINHVKKNCAATKKM